MSEHPAEQAEQASAPEADVTAQRRRLVAAAVLRGHTLREVRDVLSRQGQRNPATGRPWAISTLHADLQALRAAWRAETRQDVADAQGRVLAALREVQREAWKGGALGVVLRALVAEAKLLGLEGAPPSLSDEQWEGLIRRYVHDPAILNAIADDAEALDAGRPLAALPPGGMVHVPHE
ncbi:MAG TPA: hypothetical protein VK066_12305 [Chloroflexota bacterium]|nr:hypothetical protein [Chloroflexota bacterium]